MPTLEENQFIVLPLKDLVVYPGRDFSLFIGRERSVSSLKYAVDRQLPILLVAQRDSSDEDPQIHQLYSFGTLVSVLQMVEFSDRTIKIVVRGEKRVRVSSMKEQSKMLIATGEPAQDILAEESGGLALKRVGLSYLEQYLKLSKRTLPEAVKAMSEEDDLSSFSSMVASCIPASVGKKQEILEEDLVEKRLELVVGALKSEIDVLNTEKKIRNRIRSQVEKNHLRHYLQEQMQAIQKELKESYDEMDELDELEAQIHEAHLTKEAQKKALSEMKKLRGMSPFAAESSVVRSYIEWIVSLPWKKTSPLKKGAVKKSLEVLNEHHYGLEKVKEKVTDFLAVQERSGRKGGAVLCLVGAPGVGKTSLGKSIAKATGRKFVRVSLGGMRDESEIRGHRRTYVGSMPGKILQALKNVQVSNPLILLDEVDKVGADWRGDPASALLEVLDKEQNSTFEDHYLGFPYDLSQVMFVCTANTLNIPSPLLDRMEVIRIPGYTEEERVDIATRYLLPKNKKEAGLKGGELWVESEAVRHLIRHYCREAGVRQLDRELANICRKVTKEILLSEEKVPVVKKVSVKGRVQEAPAESKPSVVTMTEDKEGALEKSTSEARFIVTSENLKVYSGIERYFVEVSEKEPAVGITAGLAWTEVGGSILFIEALFLPGKGGQIISTGKLGDVMKESIQAALSYAKFRAFSYGVHPKSFEKRDLHIHVPEGATPKDGPSAGVAMITSIVSVLTGIPVRSDVAMTGEISLRGRVMAIGGVKEKLLSAARGGIKTVLIPRDNMKDLEDIPDSVKSILEIIPVSHADEVLKHSLVRPLVPIQEEDLDHRDKLLKMDLVNSMKPQENSRESSVRSLS